MAIRRLYLVRHGQYRVRDGEEALTALGRRQADRLGKRLAEIPFDVVHHSNMPRARETADRILRVLGPVPQRSTRLLREGIPSVGSHFEPPFRLARDTVTATRERMDRAYERFFQPSRRERHELIVAHGNIIRYLVRRALNDSARRWWQLDVQQCSLTIVFVEPARCLLVGFNDVGHLPRAMQTFL